MKLPTQNQVNTGVRYASSIVGTVVVMLGLQAKGLNVEQIKAVIQALGDFVNYLVVLIGAVAALWASIKGISASSPASQAAAVEATGAIVVTTPEIAAATPNSPNVVSNTEVKVVTK